MILIKEETCPDTENCSVSLLPLSIAKLLLTQDAENTEKQSHQDLKLKLYVWYHPAEYTDIRL